jgi:hypothetical protein
VAQVAIVIYYLYVILRILVGGFFLLKRLQIFSLRLPIIESKFLNMKKLFLFSLLFKALMFPLACTSGSNTSVNAGQVVSSGTWRVTLFTDSGNDLTSNFSGYSFTFISGGILIAVQGSITKNGIWSVSTSSNKFNIDMGVKDNSNKPLGDLTNDWQIISSSATEVKLKDNNAGSNEFVTFSKN